MRLNITIRRPKIIESTLPVILKRLKGTREKLPITQRGDIDRVKTQTRYAEDATDKYKTQLIYVAEADEKTAMYLCWTADALKKH